MADHPPSLALEPIGDASAELAPLPVYSGAVMTQAFEAYRQLQSALDRAMPDQIMTIEGRPFRKKGYWRAVAVAFHLQIDTVSEREVEDGAFDDGRANFGYHVTCRATTRTGRTVEGDGSCFAIEKAPRYRCPHPHPTRDGKSLHWPHETCPDYEPGFRWRELPAQSSQHNIRSHAHTRAFNRAVSNLVGFGEVSAEEIDRDDEGGGGESRPSSTPRAAGSGSTWATVISEPQRRRMYAIAGRGGWHEDEIKVLLKRHGFEHGNEVTRAKYDAICKELEAGVDGTRGGES
jgi:hypothetical protein